MGRFSLGLGLCLALCTCRVTPLQLAESLKELDASKRPVVVSPEAYMTTPEIIRFRGYTAEVHRVTTEDGYVLELHRIPRGRYEPINPSVRKRAVLLQHGFLDTSAAWVINPSHSALAFILADLGFDVWLGNMRGNTYSMKHIHLHPSQSEFWEYSWDEMGERDIPAMMSYVLRITGQRKLSYIGHSLGCALFFIAMIQRPEWNERIDVMIALAPASSMRHFRSPLKVLAGFSRQIKAIYEGFRINVFMDRNSIFPRMQRRFCRKTTYHALACRNIIFFLAGATPDNFDVSILPVIAEHNPGGASFRTWFQFIQNYLAGQTFNPYDYGPEENSIRYGSEEPVPYDLSRVTAPVHVFWGENDALTTPEDCMWLAGQLGNVQSARPVANFNHVDFLWAFNVRQMLYDSLVQLLPSPYLSDYKTPAPPKHLT